MLRTTSFSDSGQEQGIDQYIPPDLRRMFYKNPAAIHASHNGLDPYGFSTRGLVLYLPLWAQKGLTFKSVDAYKHTCTPSGTAKYWTPQGWYLTGDDEYIDCGRDSSLDFGSADLTAMCWFKADAALSGVAGRLITKGREGAAEHILNLIIDASDDVYIAINDGAGTKAVVYPGSFCDDAWHFVVAIRDGNNLRLNVDNAEATPTDITGYGSIADTERDLCIGIASHDEVYKPFKGIIGDVWVYTRALSAGEIAHNYNCTAFRYQ